MLAASCCKSPSCGSHSLKHYNLVFFSASFILQCWISLKYRQSTWGCVCQRWNNLDTSASYAQTSEQHSCLWVPVWTALPAKQHVCSTPASEAITPHISQEVVIFIQTQHHGNECQQSNSAYDSLTTIYLLTSQRQYLRRWRH